MSQTSLETTGNAAIQYANQVEKLSLESGDRISQETDRGSAVGAIFVTPLDPVIQTADGSRLPAVPVEEAHKINILRDKAEGRPNDRQLSRPGDLSSFDQKEEDTQDLESNERPTSTLDGSQDRNLDLALPPSRTHPLFPPLPLYGPPSRLRNLQCAMFRITSFFLSTAFLAVIVLGSTFTSVPKLLQYVWLWLTFRNPDTQRRMYKEERRRKLKRKEQDRLWTRQNEKRRRQKTESKIVESNSERGKVYEPLEGGPDKLVCDLRYYARRVGLDAEQFKVLTEDGFVIVLWHLYNPKEYIRATGSERKHSRPDIFDYDDEDSNGVVHRQYKDGWRRYPVLLMHGLLQSAGAYCTNDDDSLAFFLCKAGYDVWLGNNRCGFRPEHSLLQYHDPRMWAWNMRQMGVMDLPALVSRVLEETGFGKLGLVCHSQGTTETFVALAKEQRPELGERISVFCALAPAVYAGPLIGKMYFKFMRIISPSMFRIFFGIHSFIPLMMTMHRLLPGRLYGFMGYRVFSFLFNWSDDRWDRGLRDRLFQFAPVYVSAESMRWWLGRECFAKHRCVLGTREEGQMEDDEDEEAEEKREAAQLDAKERGKRAWYNEQVPPMALWVAGSDDLVDGRRLLRRFERGREPFVKIVHSKVIEEYEHLDVLWAMDAMEQVGQEVRDVLWQTMPDAARNICRPITKVNATENEADAIHIVHSPKKCA